MVEDLCTLRVCGLVTLEFRCDGAVPSKEMSRGLTTSELGRHMPTIGGLLLNMALATTVLRPCALCALTAIMDRRILCNSAEMAVIGGLPGHQNADHMLARHSQPRNAA